MTLSRTLTSAASAGFLVLSLTACGGADYCDLVTNYQDDVEAFDSDSADAAAFDDFTGKLREIGDAAPDESGEAWHALADAYAAAGVTGDIAEDTVLANSDDYYATWDTIMTSVEQECGLTLGE